MKDDDIRAVNHALGAIALIHDFYATGPGSSERVQDMLSLLRGNGKSLFRVNMADAIAATLVSKSVEAVDRK